MRQDYIIVKGAREHNLKNIDLKIPRNKLVVLTGLSGSGKSSLAFDTLYAEGQRRYVESLSSYARQFLGIMKKPDVETIEGLSPAISIDQKTVSHNPRSTVGTITEIYDYLRLLFSRIGHPHCPKCGREISSQSVDQIKKQVNQLFKIKFDQNPKQVRMMILSPLVRDRKGEFSLLLENLVKKGYQRVRIDGYVYDLSEEITLIKTNKHTIEAVIDRLVVGKDELEAKIFQSRLHDSLETALKLSDGSVLVVEVNDADFAFPEKPKEMVDHLFSEKFSCPSCNISLGEIEPRLFSFNTPYGACPGCHGLGTLLKVDPELVINPRLSVTEGGILPFARMLSHDTWWFRVVNKVAERYGFSLRMPISQLSKKHLDILLYGSILERFRVSGYNHEGREYQYEAKFEGVIPNLERRYQITESDFVRAEIEKYMRRETCPECQGTRLKPEALNIIIDNKTIIDIVTRPITKVLEWTEKLYQSQHQLTPSETTISRPILKELVTRLGFLASVGLEYLTLDRTSSSLAGGEAQRIRLASQIGTGLSGVLYVLDEPSIGLHQKDNKKLIETLKKLRDLGNSIIVVEHDREMMLEADFILDFGPRAGEGGGEVVASGPPQKIIKTPSSLTGKYLSGRKIIQLGQKRLIDPHRYLSITGCRQHNLKNITVDFPLGAFICVTGVSGSGKSTLIHNTLYHALSLKFNPYHAIKPGNFAQILGYESIKAVRLIDQSPIGRTPRSNPATYTKAFDHIRQLFTQTREARIRGYNKPGRFSFNVKGGRCESCQGGGQIKIEMQFLPDVYVNCEVCQGKRYNSETLEITYKDQNIAQVLNFSIEKALDFFPHIPGLKLKLQTLNDVGLGYLKLGQPAQTLSGGEAQRVKLAAELAKQSRNRSLYLLDEPTIGLHFADMEKLIAVLQKLVDKGNTVIVIEHNLDFIKNADWIIDLGPEGGESGGKVIASATPTEVAMNKNSYTGRFLRQLLK